MNTITANQARDITDKNQSKIMEMVFNMIKACAETGNNECSFMGNLTDPDKVKLIEMGYTISKGKVPFDNKTSYLISW